MKTPSILKSVELSPQQVAFFNAWCDEVLYGGAAGGGKTFIQLFEALWYAVQFPNSTQIIFRRTYPELERSVVRESLRLYPGKPYAKYNASKHVWTFWNGSVIEFGYLAREDTVTLYQGAEYHVVRMDEATHLTWYQVNYLKSRIRGRKEDGFPLALKMSTNPGGVGHMWAKNRYVDPAPPFHYFIGPDKTKRIFIPSKATDNPFINEGYIKTLDAISDENLRAMLRDGSWDVADGAFFSEFSRELHVCEPYDFLSYGGYKLFRAIDYGLDMLACYWFAEFPPTKENPYGSIICYRELTGPDLTISDAAKKIRDATPVQEYITATYAPPDVLSHRDRVTGRNQGDMFASEGLSMVKSSNDRKAGWIAIKELLKIRERGQPILKIFSTCRTLIKHLPMLLHDPKKPGDTLTEPHLITHSPDALRYYAIQWRSTHSIEELESQEKRVEYPPDMLQDYRRSNPRDRAEIERIMGGKPKLIY